MREIGELEAKNEFGQLLDMVELGEEISITCQGEQAERLKLGPFNWDEWKVYRDEGWR